MYKKHMNILTDFLKGPKSKGKNQMKDKWIKLDTAANIFPAVAKGSDTKVFRFVCELNEIVDPQILQEAVSEATKSFDVFNYIIKKGVFWYYFEKSDLCPEVREEYKPICSPLYNKEKKTLLYEITYYKTRINLEIFHALSDGTGALKFLECIVNKYLSKVHNISEPELPDKASACEKEDDGFYRYYEKKFFPGYKKDKLPNAYKLSGGSRLPDDRISVITGHIALDELLKEAHKFNTTITGYITATLISAIGELMPRRSLGTPVTIAIPINLRTYFPTESARNFFAVENIRYTFKDENLDFQHITDFVTAALKTARSKENTKILLSQYTSMENNFWIKITPLILKNAVLNIAYIRSLKKTSATFSNIGIASIPNTFSKYINAFNIFSATKNYQICSISYNNTLSLSFTSPFDNYEIQKIFFRKIANSGINVKISSNLNTFL